jgi:hypothetical protein
MPYVRQLASMNIDGFIKIDSGHAEALNMRDGTLANETLLQTFSDL